MTPENDLMTQGMRCPIDNLGIVEAQRFIAMVKTEKSDYTEWQREHYDKMTAAELYAALTEFAEQHPDDKNFTKERAV